ncbi:MoaD/ThiS family protein [Candidatus Bathyarchaeota archaeon]|nr:MAG: MoaD/ThiS family protein [Candidatus Bathyarchaeota archaeon]
MEVYVKFFSSLARQAGRQRIMEFKEGITLADAVEDIFRTLKLGKLRLIDERSTLSYVKVFHNGKIADGKSVLRDGDETAFYPPISGG